MFAGVEAATRVLGTLLVFRCPFLRRALLLFWAGRATGLLEQTAIVENLKNYKKGKTKVGAWTGSLKHEQSGKRNQTVSTGPIQSIQ